MKNTIALLLLLHFCNSALAQNTPADASSRYIRGAFSVTNNGFSFIPSFTLGKPAAILNLNAGGKRFSFEPELRFALEGKPWSFVFIWRYKLLRPGSRFQCTVGTHLPALNFRTVSVQQDGVEKNLIVAQRFLPFELTPAVALSKNIHLSMFYLYARGREKEVAQNTNFVSLRCNFSHIPLSPAWYLRFSPQVFYLKMDANDGYYAAATLSLAHHRIPLMLSTTANRIFRSSIAGKKFDWNLSLAYTFDKQYIRQ